MPQPDDATTEPCGDDGDVLRTITGPATAELPRVSGSRFVATATPVTSRAEAEAAVAAARAAAPDATHHCWARVLPDGTARCSDDGEPRDTAGAPILRHLEGAGLVGVVVVVTRWYGGTKLGRGGLVRAYGDATAAVLAAVDVVTRVRRATFRIEHGYDLTAVVDGALAASDAEVVAATYGARVERVVAVPRATAPGFVADLAEVTAGRVRARPVTASEGG